MRQSPTPNDATDPGPPATPTWQPHHRAAIIATAWTLGILAVLSMRFRAQWDAYAAAHRWAAANGVPDFVRNLDSLVICIAAAFLGARIAAVWSGGNTTGHLALRHGRRGWPLMALIALLPMVCGGFILNIARSTQNAALTELLPAFFVAAIRAPIAEEMLFRGLLVGVCAAAIGWRGQRFWFNAAAASALFAAMHIPWNAQALAAGWPTLLVTAAGGLWYAWLLERWRSLWVPMILHAGMNLGWLLADATGGAAGGGWIENTLRAATIAAATWWTIRSTRNNNNNNASKARPTTPN